jgi:thioredoxin reductase (NADPH)
MASYLRNYSTGRKKSFINAFSNTPYGAYLVEDVIIIGSGPAGLSAAIYTAREDFKPLLIGGSVEGGQLILTTTVDNMPGFPDGIMGPEIIEKMMKQAKRFGTRIVQEDVTDLDLTKKPFMVKTSAQIYQAKTIIIATGANAKMLGIPSEMEYMGKGTSACATCDGPFFKGKDVVVVGGGDTAMEDSDFLTKFCKSITILHRREVFRASKAMQNRVLSNPKIKTMFNTEVLEIAGNGKTVTGVKIKNNKTGAISTIPTQGVFVAIGHEPNTKFLAGKLKMDELGYIMTKNEVMTDIEGVFVAGDCADRFYRQAGTAAGSGIKAALRVREYLQATK